MHRNRILVLAVAALAALWLGACGGEKQDAASNAAGGENQRSGPSQDGSTQPSDSQPPPDQQTLSIGAFQLGPLGDQQAQELVADLGLQNIQAQQVTKDGEEVLVTVAATMPAGQSGPDAVKSLLSKLSGGGSPEESTIQDQKILVVTGSNGKTYMAPAESGDMFQVLIGADRESIETAIREITEASAQMSGGASPQTPAPTGN